MFQATMDTKARRKLGIHYAEEENILKLIKPLFMNDLNKEFEEVQNDLNKLDIFHKKLSNLKFLDPACGTGNFLIIAYRELRRLELKIIEKKREKNKKLSIEDYKYVINNSIINVNQFYGLEIDPLAIEIAKIGMWLINHQCNMELNQKFWHYYERPSTSFKEFTKIFKCNALRVDWLEVLEVDKIDFILGNPPFVGASRMTKDQKQDIQNTVKDPQNRIIKGNGNIDYVVGWYYKASQLTIKNKNLRIAFVSTNNITQGEQTAIVWKSLMEDYKIKIDFAHRTFKWTSQARGKASVHCVIVGFSNENIKTRKIIYDADSEVKAENINGYLVNFKNIFIERRTKPICEVPVFIRGSDSVDGGNLIIDDKEYECFVNLEPKSKKYIKQYMMGKEFINGLKRYCLWLVDVSPTELQQMPEVLKRIQKCKEARLNMKSEQSRKYSEQPSLFATNRQPNTDYIAIPIVSSENRQYIPIDYLSKDIIAGEKLFTMQNATIYHFGILTSNIHMAWMRAICGRLENRYSYSNTIVYNNFPWPTPTDKQRISIEQAAKNVLDTRAMYTNDSLATLYDPITMPPSLIRHTKY